ncbi:MAG: DUF1573 domain-containing protein [Urechidicola sp.]|nr:DUF1573 domain-containing protein [Urechidicola sp.]
MKKVVFITVALATLTFASCTKESASAKVKAENVKEAEQRDAAINKGAPIIEWNKTEHDFGNINQGDKVETIFTLTNVGEGDLIVTKAKGSCGCTVPQWPREAIAPGKTADIKVVFNSRGKKNKSTNTITLTTNTAKGSEVVRIKAFVKVPDSKTTVDKNKPMINDQLN